ncbi:MAG: VOC family protein [Acidobacteriota bacterium]|nr:VOC family protein [Acidobacteriota bacterium]
MNKEVRPWLSHHILSIKDTEKTSAFYRERFGMVLVDRVERTTDAGTERRLFMGFAGSGSALLNKDDGATLLEFHHSDTVTDTEAVYTQSRQDAYWKIGITLRDVDRARRRLLDAGVKVSEPAQFYDIGYLCHLKDPTGFCIELLQHDFAQNFRPAPPEPHPLGSTPTLGQITLRIEDPGPMLHFYRDLMGMKLLSRQVVAPHRFTLYFLACTDEAPPHADPDAVENREWLWRRPYCTLELQHKWDAETKNISHRKHDELPLGFRGMGFTTRALPQLLDKLAGEGIPASMNWDWGLRKQTAVIQDPEGNLIRLSEPIRAAGFPAT